MSNHKSAIKRKRLSVPAQKHLATIKSANRWLDYGCGRGDDIALMALKGVKGEGYDPHYQPKRPKGKFDLITCSYVFNVIPLPLRIEAIVKIMSLLTSKGQAIITVRNDLRRDRKIKDSYMQYADGLDGVEDYLIESGITYSRKKNELIVFNS